MVIGHRITKRFQEKTILDDVSFRIVPGQITAIIGLNGSGKTTLLKMIAGILRADEGYLRVNGTEPSQLKREAGIRIAFLSKQSSNLSGYNRVKDAITGCRKAYHVSNDYFEYLWSHAGSMLNMETLWEKECKTLSLGDRMKVEFFYTCLMRPTLWIMDEPTLGIDYETRLRMYEILQDVKSGYREMTVLIATHNIQEMEILCDRVLVLHEGKMIFSGPVEYLKQKYQTLGVLSCNVKQGTIAFQDVPIKWYQVDGSKIKLLFDKHYVNAVTILKCILETAKVEDISIDDMDMESMIKNIFRKER